MQYPIHFTTKIMKSIVFFVKFKIILFWLTFMGAYSIIKIDEFTQKTDEKGQKIPQWKNVA